MTINLENRREIDFRMIADATKRKGRTFTELLHITKLPRKTLSLRLKELCSEGSLVKSEKEYKLNGMSEFNDDFHPLRRFTSAFGNERIKTGLMLITLLFAFTASGYVLANLMPPIPVVKDFSPEPLILGSFAMSLDISNVEDLYTWQVAIVYDQSELKVLDVSSGGFAGDVFVNSTDSTEDLLLLGGTLKGAVSGQSGSGRLATITFGYYTEDYEAPPAQIIAEKVFDTYLENSQGQPIHIAESTLTLTEIP